MVRYKQTMDIISMNDGSVLTNNGHNVYGSVNNGSIQTMAIISMNDGSVLTN